MSARRGLDALLGSDSESDSAPPKPPLRSKTVSSTNPEKKPKKIKTTRNKDLGVWLVVGTNIVVKSPRNHKVLGYIDDKRKIAELTPALKKKATKLGLV